MLLIITFTGEQEARYLSGIVLYGFVRCSDPHIMEAIWSAVVQSHGKGADGHPVSACTTTTSTASCSFCRHWMYFQMDGCWCPLRCLYLFFHPLQTFLMRESPVTVALCTFQEDG